MNTIKKLFPYIKPYMIFVILSPLFMMLEVTMDLAQPRFTQKIIDIGIANRDTAYVLHTSAKMLGAALLGVIGGVGCTIFSTLAAICIGTETRNKLFSHIQTLSAADCDKLERGSLITRLTNDIDQLQEAIIMLLRMLVRSPLLVIGSLFMAVVTSPKLAVMFILLLPFIIFMLWLINKRGLPLFSLVQKRIDKINSVIEENLSGIRVIKAFVRSRYEENRFAVSNDNLYRSNVAVIMLMITIFPIMFLAINTAIVCALWFGGNLVVVHKSMEVGGVLAFITYLTQTAGSMTMMGMIISRLSRAGVSADRIIEVMDTQPSITESAAPANPKEVRGEITFDNVTAAYSGAPILENISFTVKPGEKLVVMGETGSGKSTLVNLIPRLYDTAAGNLLIDGVNVRDISFDFLRKHIAIVMQKTMLFSGTVRENIRYGNPEADDNDIDEALKAAQAYDFVTNLSEGADTVLGQNGVNLSGGQRQRLTIARALAAKPAILIFDDCTSALDMTTERKLLAALENMNCTKVIVAQRLTTAKDADRVLVLDKGGIAGLGTYEELAKSCEVFRRIAESQNKGETLNG